MEQWPYSGNDLCGDLDMPLPDGEDFNDEGKKIIFVLILRFFNCFWYICAYNISLVNAEVGLEWLVWMSSIARRIPHHIDGIAPY